jgi:hypothetical protein
MLPLPTLIVAVEKVNGRVARHSPATARSRFFGRQLLDLDGASSSVWLLVVCSHSRQCHLKAPQLARSALGAGLQKLGFFLR